MLIGRCRQLLVWGAQQHDGSNPIPATLSKIMVVTLLVLSGIGWSRSLRGGNLPAM